MTEHSVQEVNDKYKRLLSRFDSDAIKTKKMHFRLWFIVFFLTWTVLLASIVFLTVFKTNSETAEILRWVFGIIGLVNAVLIFLQIIMCHRGRWLAYRAATERLRSEAMRFRANAMPYEVNSDNDEKIRLKLFSKRIEYIASQAEDPEPPWGKIKLISLIRTLRGPKKNTIDATNEDISKQITEEEYLDGRINNQSCWYLKKSRNYLRLQFLFGIGLILTFMTNFCWTLLIGYNLMIFALMNTLSLSLLSWRDFLGYGVLAIRYSVMHTTLGEIVNDITKRQTEKNKSYPLHDRVNQVETILNSEFSQWFATCGGFNVDEPLIK